jgi:hypothetical protein
MLSRKGDDMTSFPAVQPGADGKEHLLMELILVKKPARK